MTVHAVPVDSVPGLVLAAEAQTGGSSLLSNLVPFLLLAVAFWFLLLRPQRKRAQEAVTLRRSMHVGASVMTTSGLYGTVAHIDEDAVLLEVAPGVTNRYATAAVARILSPSPDAVDEADDEADGDETDGNVTGSEAVEPADRAALDERSDERPDEPRAR